MQASLPPASADSAYFEATYPAQHNQSNRECRASDISDAHSAVAAVPAAFQLPRAGSQKSLGYTKGLAQLMTKQRK
jgi:hypothetical protein